MKKRSGIAVPGVPGYFTDRLNGLNIMKIDF